MEESKVGNKGIEEWKEEQEKCFNVKEREE
jgi:hypothetical protein